MVVGSQEGIPETAPRLSASGKGDSRTALSKPDQGLGRVRASFGVFIGFLALATGFVLRFFPAHGMDEPRLGFRWIVFAFFLSLAAVLSTWLSRPVSHWLFYLGVLPWAGLLGLVMPLLSWWDHQAQEVLVPAALESSGGFAIVVALIRYVCTGASQNVVPFLFDKKKKFRLLKDDGKQVEVTALALARGDRVLLSSGAWVPVDGVVARGGGTVDGSPLLGAAHKRAVSVDDTVLAGTRMVEGEVVVRASKKLEESQVSVLFRHAQTAVSDLAQPGKDAQAWALLSGLLWAGGIVWVMTRQGLFPLVGSMPIVAALTLGMVAAVPGLALFVIRRNALRIAFKRGLHVSDAKALLAWLDARSWVVDWRLLVDASRIGVESFFGMEEKTVLQAAHALAEPGFLRTMFEEGLLERRLSETPGAALKRRRGVYYGTVRGERWFLCPFSLWPEVDQIPDLSESQRFEALARPSNGVSIWILGKVGDGPQAALRISLTAKTAVSELMKVLRCSRVRADPAVLLQPLASALDLEVVSKIRPREGLLLRQSKGVDPVGSEFGVVLSADAIVPEAGTQAVMFEGAAFQFPEVFELGRRVRWRLWGAPFAVLLLPCVALALCWIVGILTPLVGTLVGALAVAQLRFGSWMFR